MTLIVEDNTDAQGRERFMQGGNEPILTAGGDRITDSHGRVSRVTTAGYSPTLGKMLIMGYLPAKYCEPGTEMSVMYMNELFPCTVVGTGSAFDPENTRLKG